MTLSAGVLVAKATGIGIVAGVAANIGELAGRQIRDMTGLHLGQLVKAMPQCVIDGATLVAEVANNAIRAVAHPLLMSERISTRRYSIMIAPIVEEGIYRFVGQAVPITLLNLAGVPKMTSTAIAVTANAIVFGLAHSPDPATEQFAATAIKSAIFSIAQILGGGSASVVRGLIGTATSTIAHSISNAIIWQSGIKT